MTELTNDRTTDLILVEDDAEAREALAELLEFEGFRVIACAYGLEALAALRDQPRPVLVTDFILPGIDGIDLAHEAVRRHPACGIVIVSGHPPTVGNYPTAWQWVQKPFGMEALLAAIQHAKCD